MTIRYLVTATDERGVLDAAERGWVRLAYARFATPEKDDIRMIRRFVDLVPLPGRTEMYKSSDYDTAATVDKDDQPTPWGRDKEGFDKFVADGHGEWL